jgi:hypothetical protein
MSAPAFTPADARRLSRKVGELVELAHSYWADGAPRTAAARLREAADLLDQCADIRDQLLGTTGRAA